MIKKILFASFFSFSSMFLFAQCQPDNTLQWNGFYPPDNSSELITPTDTFTAFPPVGQGQYYEDALHFLVWTDTLIEVAQFPFPVLAAVDSVVLTSVSGFPNGITYTCNPPNCVFLGSNSGCANIFGITNDPIGTYPISFNIDVHGTALTVSDVFPSTIDLFALVVTDSSVISLTENNIGHTFLESSNFPNPFLDETHILFRMAIDTEVEFIVFDLLGNIIFQDRINGFKGENKYHYKHMSGKGIYMYQLSDGEQMITKRFISN